MKMIAVIAVLVLLLPVYDGQLQCTQTEQEIETQLVELKDELRQLKERLNSIQMAPEDKVTALKAEVEALKQENSAQAAELVTVKNGLANTLSKVLNWEKGVKGTSKVAFTAGLGSADLYKTGKRNLVFTKVLINAGQAYSSLSGIFTAPVMGVYYFRFTIAASGMVEFEMHKNDKLVMLTGETGSDLHTVSSGLTILLMVGDRVNIHIPRTLGKVLDNDKYLSSFSGFLLFSL